MRKTLITGGGGFVGTNLIHRLRERNDSGSIVVLDDESLGSLSHLRALDPRGGPLSCVQADILEPDAIGKAARGCDTVIHLAANTRVIESIADPRLNFEVNVRGTFNVLMAARDAGVRRVVIASTGGAILGDVEPPVHEAMVPQPIAPYGASKLAAEAYGHAFAGAYGMKVTSLRFSNVYGPHSYRKGSAVAHFFRQILDRQPITIFGDGLQERDFVYVDDLCRGILQAIEAEAEGVFQLGSGRPTSINALLEEMRRIVGPAWSPTVRYEAARTGEIKRTYCDITKSQRTFDFRPATPLADGLSATWQWFLAHAPR
jgi:UDP-glucose 4-epimerase